MRLPSSNLPRGAHHPVRHASARLCDASSFAALGVIAPLCLRLDLLQLHRPMEAQALAWPHLHSGEDAVLVSEAGSGKTLSYLLPLIQSVWEAEERGDAESGQVAVVVPTQDLAVQVLRVARQLCAEGPLECADAAGDARGAHVLVGTPSNMVQCLGRGFRDRPGTLRLVLDEADMLLAGVKKTGTSGDNPVVRLLDGVKPPSATRRSKPAKGTKPLKGGKGGKGAGGAGKKKGAAAAAAELRPGDWACHECDAVVFASKDACFKCGAAKPAAPTEALEILEMLGTLPGTDDVSSSAAAAAAAAPPAQIVLVSATIPAQGGRSVGSFLSGRFPSIRWLRSDGAHRPIGTLTTQFVRVGSRDERKSELLRLLGARHNRTMVFANTAAQADNVGKMLTAEGVDGLCGVYHPNLAGEARRQSLARFEKDETGVLVCSGLGGRGIDVSAPGGVGQVVQYTLAPHMVEYMHRVGRTARAGAPGHAVALVAADSPTEQALVDEVERCVAGSWKFV